MTGTTPTPEAIRRLRSLIELLKQSWDYNGDPVETEDFEVMLDLVNGKDVPRGWWDQ